MKTLINKTYLGIFAVTCMLTIATSCKKDNDEPDVVYGNAKVRVVNAVPTSEPQDFYQGTQKITTTPVAYGTSSNPLTIKAGYSVVSFHNASNNAVNVQNNLGIDTDVSATVFYSVEAGTGNLLIDPLTEDNVAPAAGKVKINFVNLAALANSVGVKTVAGAVVTDPLLYRQISRYVIVDANVDLVANVTTNATTTTIPGASLVAGKNYIIWFDAASLTTVQYHIIQQN